MNREETISNSRFSLVVKSLAVISRYASFAARSVCPSEVAVENAHGPRDAFVSEAAVEELVQGQNSVPVQVHFLEFF